MKNFALVCVLLLVSPAIAQISRVQSIDKWNCSGSGSSVSCQAMLGATGSGHLLAVWTFWESTSTYTASVKDSVLSNNFVSAVGPTLQSSASTPTSSQIFYARNIQGSVGNDQVTVTFAGPSNGSISPAGIVAVEYSGLDQVNPLDDVSAGYSVSGSPGSSFDSGWATLGLGSLTNVLIFGAAVADASGTPAHGTNFTLVKSSASLGLCGLTEEWIFAASASNFQHANATCGSGNWAMQMAVFRSATFAVTGGWNPARPAQVQFADQFPGSDPCAQTKAAMETSVSGNSSPVADSRGPAQAKLGRGTFRCFYSLSAGSFAGGGGGMGSRKLAA